MVDIQVLSQLKNMNSVFFRCRLLSWLFANRYIQAAAFNGRPLNQWWIRQKDLLKGGRLVLELGPTPNPNWAKVCPLPNQ
jgi:hypothetical protein